jgi:hypothetical protein
MGIRTYFKGARLARMSSGTYCIIRDLGLVKGGKGLRHHENLLTLTVKGFAAKAVELVQRRVRSARAIDRPATDNRAA